MSKNTIRKGLALGLGLSLVGATFAGFPANAAITTAGDGTTAILAVAPTSGPASALAVIAADGATFSLTASPATAIMGGGELKYKVTDPNAKFLPSQLTTGGDSDSLAAGVTEFYGYDQTSSAVGLKTVGVADGSYLMWAETALQVTDNANANATTILAADTLVDVLVSDNIAIFKSSAALLTATAFNKIAATTVVNFVLGGQTAVADSIAIADNEGVKLTSADPAAETLKLADVAMTDGTYIGFFTANLASDAGAGHVVGTLNALGDPVQVTVVSNVATFVSAAHTATANQAATVNGATTLRVISTIGAAVRGADNSYVVSTGVTAANTTAALEIEALDAVTRSVTATAFVDAFADDIIGGTEYASVPTTIQFLERTGFSATTVLTPPTLGDESLTAKVTVSPMINLAQNGNTDLVDVVFTRQDSVTNGVSKTVATQDVDTGVITQSVPLEIAADNLDSYTATTGVVSTAGTSEWESVAGTILVTPADGIAVTNATSSITDEVVSITSAAHGLRVGDVVVLATVTGTDAALLNAAAGHVVTSVPSTTTYTFVLEDATDRATFSGTVTHDVNTYATGAGDALVDRVFAGDYAAFAILESAVDHTYTKLGATQTLGNTSAVAADVVFSSVASATLQGKSLKTDDASEKILISKGTTSEVITVTVVDKLGAAVGAGRPVVTTLSVRTAAVRVNALTTGQTLLTDANGQVSLTVSSTTAADGDAVTIAVVAEGVSTADSKIVVEWDTQAYSLYDLSTTQAALASYSRSILASSSYSMNLMLADQWYQAAPSATYRIQVTGTGSNAGNISLVDGKATVTVTDLLGANFATVVAIQKATAGVFATTDTVTVSNVVVAAGAAKVTMAANGATLFAGKTADLSDKVAAKALVERDLRAAFAAQPAYVNDVVIAGKVTKTTSGASYAGAVVTISGSTSILFSDGDVDSRGSITVVANASGEFSATLYSTTAMTDAVITVTALGASSTSKVSFVGAGIGEGTSLVVTMPAAVKPASTFQVKAKLSDAFGNGVNTVAGSIKVTYSGAGIVFGTLPTETDANGELMFSVLLGSNDTGSVNVTVSYDQNADGDYVDVKDLVTAGTTAITATGKVAASSDTIVNVGTFSGKLVVYALNAAGSEVSYKIAGKWVTQVVTSDLLQRYDRVVGATGATIKVDIYVDGVLKLAKSVVTK
jgi:hypothetical protein